MEYTFRAKVAEGLCDTHHFSAVLLATALLDLLVHREGPASLPPPKLFLSAVEQLMTLVSPNLRGFLPTLIAIAATIAVANADEPKKALPPPASEALSCLPDTATAKDKITIKLPTPHSGDFAVITPSGDYLFISFNQPDKASLIQPVIPAETFQRLPELVLDVATATGVPWIQDAPAIQPMFTKSGDYKFVLSKALETEDPVLDGWCVVTFRK